MIFKGILKEELYDNFLTFSVAVCLLVCPGQALTHNGYAKELLKYFVEQGCNLYGPQFLAYNVHSMLHLAAAVEVSGNLDQFSAFPFENYLHQLKLVQIVKRLNEMMTIQNTNKRKEGNLATRRPNNSYILDNSCCEVTG